MLVDSGAAAEVLPEIPALRLETDEHFQHKDVYQHSLTVLDQAIGLEDRYDLRQDLVLRLAALLHDIGKPKTRSRLPGNRVAFHHHEVVGAKMARKRLTALRFPRDVVENVSRLVELHLRFHGYGDGEWTDSAVRRYVTDAGPLLDRLHALTRADCTTRNQAKAQRLARAYDDLEARITELAAQEELAAIRPDPQRRRDHGDPRDRAGAAGRQGHPVPARAAAGARPARPRPGRSGTAALGRGRWAGRARLARVRHRVTAEQPVAARRDRVARGHHADDHRVGPAGHRHEASARAPRRARR